jgi:hypothetical protein
VPTSANGGSGLNQTWTLPNFNDSSWMDGTVGVGYDTQGDFDGIFSTDLEAEMKGVNPSVYIRTEVNIPNPSALLGLNLRIKYDDGFILFLNDHRVAQRNAPPTRFAYSSPATGEHADVDATEYEVIGLENFQSFLVPGRNVFAIQAMNRSTDDDDFLFVPELFTFTSRGGTEVTLNESASIRARALVGNQWSAEVRSDFVLPAALRVTEIMYNPPPVPVGSPFVSSDFEFIELQNTGSRAVSMAGYQLRDGIDFTFGAMTLEPGAYAVVVNNRAAFESMYGVNIPVAGEFDGNLSNSGEAIQLLGPTNAVVQQFAFSDGWYATTDGEGLSLSIRDASAPLDAWNGAAAWKGSSRAGGTPGGPDAPQQPGDTNGDGQVDLADLNNVRNHFGEAGPNVVGDTNGDQVVDLVDLNAVRNFFGAGQPLIAIPRSATAAALAQSHAVDTSAASERKSTDLVSLKDAVFAQFAGTEAISPRKTMKPLRR